MERCSSCTFCQPPKTSSTVTHIGEIFRALCRNLLVDRTHAQAKTRIWWRELFAGLQPFQHALPILLRAIEAVAIDFSFNTRDFARRGELPKRVRPFAVKPLRRSRDRAQP